MPDQRTSSSAGSSLGDRLAKIIAETGSNPGTAAPSESVSNSRGAAEWHVIHAGQEQGPLPLANLIEKAVAGLVEADDLVKTTGGSWLKAREIAVLQREFALRECRKSTVNQFRQFHGIWRSRRSVMIGGFLLAIVVLVVVWVHNSASQALQPGISEGISARQPDSSEPEQADSALSGKANDTTVHFFIDRGCVRLDKGDYDNAISDFDEAIRLEPNNTYAFIHRGWAWENKNSFSNAIRDYSEAIRLEPANAGSYNVRGYARLGKKHYDDAIKDFDEAIRLDLVNALFYYNRGLAWHGKRNYDLAIKDYSTALMIDPKYALCYAERGIAWYDKKNFDQAIKDFDQAIRLNPDDAFSYVDRASAWSKKRDFDRAIRDYNEAIRLNPDNAAFYSLRSKAWLAKRDNEKAKSDFDEASRIDPKGFPQMVGDFGADINTEPEEAFQDRRWREITAVRKKLNLDQPVPVLIGKKQAATIEGCFLLADDKQYLGKITRNEFDAESILNEFGKYGGKFSTTSIFNDFGLYGGEFALKSPFNKYTLSPPRIYGQDGEFVAYLTANTFKYPRIDPHVLIGYLKGR